MFDGMCTEYTEYTGYTDYTDYAELYLHCTVPAVAVARFLPNTELPVNGLVAAWRCAGGGRKQVGSAEQWSVVRRRRTILTSMSIYLHRI